MLSSMLSLGCCTCMFPLSKKVYLYYYVILLPDLGFGGGGTDAVKNVSLLFATPRNLTSRNKGTEGDC